MVFGGSNRSTAVQIQTGNAYFSSEQLLPVGFASTSQFVSADH